MRGFASAGATASMYWTSILAVSMAVSLILAAWLINSLLVSRSLWAAALLLSVLHLLMTILWERALAVLPFSPAWRYRLAFFASVGVILVDWLQWRGVRQVAMSFLWVIPPFIGAFLGGLAATARAGLLWENNSPPTEVERQEVHRRHLEVIGAPQPIAFEKRAFDILLSLLGLVLSFPIWFLSALLIWLEDPGPILFVKNSVGRGGVTFLQFKFRSMVRGAEESTGPVLASERDQRVLLAGGFMRKTALDELPQLLNILRGEMSFVGPRPQRTVLVRRYLEEIPEFAERHRVAPGLAGLAQVAGDYYLTPRQKLRLDRLYIQHMSLGFDIKLLVLAFLITFWFRWQPGWNGRLPRRLLRLGSR